MRFVMRWMWPLWMLVCGYACAAEIPALVGRVSYASGEVQFYGEEQGQWEPAYQNEPVTSHNSVYTGENGRTELRFSDTAIGFGPETQLDIARLDELTFAATVAKGSIVLSKGGLARQESTTVSIAGTQFQLLGGGRYRFDVAPDGAGATATVLAGRLTALLGDGPTPVDAGSALVIANGEATVRRAEVTDLDSWLEARLRRQAAPQATRYVSPLMTGYDELDANGRWQTDPNYGTVWYPTTVSADWVPYRFGHWRWVSPWGWTWIDDQPWGFAPFHYGRWVDIGDRWCWVPGRYERRPVYAPALVAFVGGAAGFAVSASISNGPAVGWYPLAPWERYTPSYTRNSTYISDINRVTIANPPRGAFHDVNNTRMSINQLRGATVVPRSAFASSRSIATAAVAVAPAALATQPVSHSGPALPRPEPRAQALPGMRASEAAHGPITPNPVPLRQEAGAQRTPAPARLGPSSPPSPRPTPPNPPAIGAAREEGRNRPPQPAAPSFTTPRDVRRENGASPSEVQPSSRPGSGPAPRAPAYEPAPRAAEPVRSVDEPAAHHPMERLPQAQSAPRPELPQRVAPPASRSETRRSFEPPPQPAAAPASHSEIPRSNEPPPQPPAAPASRSATPRSYGPPPSPIERAVPPSETRTREPIAPMREAERPSIAPPARPPEPAARPGPPTAPVRAAETREAPRAAPAAPVTAPAPHPAPPAAVHPAAPAHPEVRRDEHEPH